jgi:DNA replication and repair protein RecF
VRLTSLSLQSFRSYPALSLTFGEQPVHVFVGDNGSGKTNIVEAVSLLSQGRSCLRADFTDMLRYGDGFFKVRAGTLSDDGFASTAECVFQISPRRATAFFVQDVRTPLLSFIGAVPSITFLPQDLDLFTGPPAGRRGFIDALLCQLTPEYASVRLQYERVLKQRNALLKRIAAGETPESDLDVWDAELAQAGELVRARRSGLIGRIGKALHAELASLGEEFGSVVFEEVPAGDDLVSALRAARAKDIIIQSTTVGPHRDDWNILADQHSIGPFLSRGQQRTVFLALLFVSAGLFGSIRKEKPVILLDDVLSELDQHHQDSLLTRLRDHQVFVTTTHPVAQDTGLLMWEVRGGSVTPA